MAGDEKRTELICFRLTPSEDQILRKAVAIQQSEQSAYFRNHSESYRTVLLRWAEKVIADAAAKSRRRRQARARARIHVGKEGGRK